MLRAVYATCSLVVTFAEISREVHMSTSIDYEFAKLDHVPLAIYSKGCIDMV
jgi:hypothetical protein